MDCNRSGEGCIPGRGNSMCKAGASQSPGSWRSMGRAPSWRSEAGQTLQVWSLCPGSVCVHVCSHREGMKQEQGVL